MRCLLRWADAVLAIIYFSRATRHLLLIPLTMRFPYKMPTITINAFSSSLRIQKYIGFVVLLVKWSHLKAYITSCLLQWNRALWAKNDSRVCWSLIKVRFPPILSFRIGHHYNSMFLFTVHFLYMFHANELLEWILLQLWMACGH